VLYPGEAPVSKLRAIYVLEGERADTVRAMISFFPVPSVPVLHKPEVFT
jgi:hypothetical protein